MGDDVLLGGDQVDEALGLDRGEALVGSLDHEDFSFGLLDTLLVVLVIAALLPGHSGQDLNMVLFVTLHVDFSELQKQLNL